MSTYLYWKKEMKYHTWISSTNCHTTTGLQETLCQVNRMMTLYLGCCWFAEIKLVWQLTVCGKSSGHFFCQPTGKMPTLAKASHHLSKAFPTCSSLLHLWEKGSTVLGGALHSACMFEGGNLLNLTPVANTPPQTLQLHKLCDSVTEPSLPASVRFIISSLKGIVSICIC